MHTREKPRPAPRARTRPSPTPQKRKNPLLHCISSSPSSSSSFYQYTLQNYAVYANLCFNALHPCLFLKKIQTTASVSAKRCTSSWTRFSPLDRSSCAASVTRVRRRLARVPRSSYLPQVATRDWPPRTPVSDSTSRQPSSSPRQPRSSSATAFALTALRWKCTARSGPKRTNAPWRCARPWGVSSCILSRTLTRGQVTPRSFTRCERNWRCWVL